MMVSDPLSSAEQRLALWRRSLDAALLAGITLAVLDWVGSKSGPEEAADLIQMAALLCAASPLGACALGLTSWAALALPLRSARARRLCAVTAGVALASPWSGTLLKLAYQPSRSFAILLAAVAALVVLGYLVGRRANPPIAWLAAALISAVMADQLLSTLAVRMRVSTVAPDLWLAIALVALALQPPLALTVYALIRRCTGGRVPRPLLVAAWVACAVVWLAMPRHIPTAYPRVLTLTHITAGLLAALGATALEIGGRLPTRLVAPSLGGIAFALLLAFSPSATLWRLANHSALGRTIAPRLDVLRVVLQRDSMTLRKQPEFLMGQQLAADAVRWNRRHSWSPAKTRPLSILLIMMDSVRYDHTGYSGKAPAGLTPFLDELAAKSVRFHRCYSTAARTTIVMPSLMWSRYPGEIGFARFFEDSNKKLYFADEVPPTAVLRYEFQAPRNEKRPNLAELLNQAGLETTAIANDGSDHGFDPRLHFTHGFRRELYPREWEGRRIGRPVDGVGDTVALDLALAELRRYQSQRFFIWVQFYDPHSGHVTPPDEPYWKGYQAEIHATDARVRRLVTELADLGRAEDTVVVVAADHGECFRKSKDGEHGLDLWDDSTHVPLLINIPGVAPADISMAVGLIDFAPTLLMLAGVEIPDTMQGFSLVPWIEGSEKASRPPAFIETWHRNLGERAPSVHLIAAVQGHHKVICDVKTGLYSCHDLDRDPGEVNAIPSMTKDPACAALGGYLLGWWTAHGRGAAAVQ